MTYVAFHLVFTLPLLAVLALLVGQRRRALPAGAHLALGVHVLLALVYTTPWDNYLVARGVWGYGEGCVLLTLGWVPIEEYLFFILQTLITGCWVLLVHMWAREGPLRAPRRGWLTRAAGLSAWLALAAAGVLALATEQGTYFGLIAAWAAPVLAFQWGFGGDLLRARWRKLALSALPPTLYLWLADWFAIGSGIWWISPRYTTGWQVLGLPFEEALFFLLTNLLVVFGMLLFLEPVALERLRALPRVRWWQGALVLWALSMIPTPLLPNAFLPLSYLSTGLLTLGVFGATLARYGRRAWGLFAVAFGFGLAVEWLGKTTGFPFGAYSYTAPGPALLGVPLLVPLGWFAFVIVALAVAPVGQKYWFAPLALVAWDVGLDPLMVSKGFWQFERGFYYGVPLSNFLGWALAGFVLMALLTRLEPRLTRDSPLELRATYGVQTFFITVGLLFFGLPWAALAALVCMSAVGIVAWRWRR